MKLVVPERESGSMLDAVVRASSACTSIVGRVELERAVRRHPHADEARISWILSALEVLPLHVANAAVAAIVPPPRLRSLDAIHLATLLEIADDVDAFYCYDERLAEAARSHGINVLAPA